MPYRETRRQHTHTRARAHTHPVTQVCDSLRFYNVDEYAFVTFMYTHGLIPERPYELCVQACQWSVSRSHLCV